MSGQPPEKTHFGFTTIAWEEKEKKINAVFESVATRYDRMNDVLSLGIHRLWKRIAIDLSQVRPGQCVLDLAGGSGDLTRLLGQRVGANGMVVLMDLCAGMIHVGRNRLINEGFSRTLRFIQGNAQLLPFADNTFHAITMGFGLRNVTDKSAALTEMYRTCKPGGKVMILEFSTPTHPGFKLLYDAYSFHIVPKLGEYIAHDKASYQYLVESIRMHPDQQTLKNMMQEAGFEDCQYHNLSGGIVAIHTAYKY